VDRLFLDANVLFSAAYKIGPRLLDLWRLKNVQLCSSRYALEEARINLAEDTQRHRLEKLSRKLEIFDEVSAQLPRGVHLPEKDAPILLGAIAARATHLLTGDVRHFGPYFGKKVAGILILAPGDYLNIR